MQRVYKCLALVFVVAINPGPSSIACSCAPKPSLRTAVSQASAVFVGRVVSRRTSSWIDHRSTCTRHNYTFEVKKLYKGPRSAELVVFTGHGEGDCGFVFEAGKTYLVYAYDVEELETSICTRTVEIMQAEADLAELGEPGTEFVHESHFPILTVLAAVTTGFMIGVFAARRWRPKVRRSNEPFTNDEADSHHSATRS